MAETSQTLVPAALRAAQLLDVLAEQRQPLGLTELARRLDAPKSSVHALCQTLIHVGLVRRTVDGGFVLGAKVMEWARAFAARSDLPSDFFEVVETLPALAGETVMLSVLDGIDVVYLACRPGSKPLSVNFRAGARIPAACTSSGKAMLSTWSEADVRALLAQHPLKPITAASLRTPEQLLTQLALIRRQGYAIDDEETAEGLLCTGAAVRGAEGEHAVAGVAVSVVKSTLDDPRRADLREAIAVLAQELSHRQGSASAQRV